MKPGEMTWRKRASGDDCGRPGAIVVHPAWPIRRINSKKILVVMTTSSLWNARWVG